MSTASPRRPSDTLIWVVGLIVAAAATGIALAGVARLGAALTLGVVVLGAIVVGTLAVQARVVPRPGVGSDRPSAPRRATPTAHGGPKRR